MGVKLDLLFNANCYGGRAVSQSFENEICSIVDHIGSTAGDLEIVTTTSLFIARTIKRHFPTVEVRASVNMRIGEPQAMDYVSGLFDSFYLRRDWQRDLAYVKKVKDWCDKHNKGLCLLANSGCLYACPGQSFHDNLVAHDAEVDEMKNAPEWTPHVCWHLYRDPEQWVNILRSTWIRPEDLHHYEGLAKVVKLATRQHSHPRLVIAAYTRGKCDSDLLALLEPGFGPALNPKYLANDQFPADWFEKTSTCGRACDTCGYCPNVLKQVLREHGAK